MARRGRSFLWGRRLLRFLSGLLDGAVFLLSLLVFLIGLYALYDSFLVYRHAADDSLLVFKPGYEQDAQVSVPEEMVFWLTFGDIDLPVMQGADNQEFLNKDPYGEFSLSGSLFLDARNDAALLDGFSLVYGHHMEGDFMFGSLHDLLSVEEFSALRFGELLVDDLVYPIVSFAVLEVDATDPVIFAPTECAFSEVLSSVSDHALILDPLVLSGKGMADEADLCGPGEDIGVLGADLVLSQEGDLFLAPEEALFKLWLLNRAGETSKSGAGRAAAPPCAVRYFHLPFGAALRSEGAASLLDQTAQAQAGTGTDGTYSQAGVDGTTPPQYPSAQGDALTQGEGAQQGASDLAPVRLLALSTCKYPDSVERVVVFLRLLSPVSAASLP